MADTETRTCEKHGPYESRNLRGVIWSLCERCIDEDEAEKLAAAAAREQERKRTMAAAKVAASGVPPRFRGKTIAGYQAENPGQKTAKNFASAFVGKFGSEETAGANALMLGTVGTGKTHLACAIVQDLLEAGRTAHYAGAAAFIQRVKDTWVPGAKETESDVVAVLTRPDLLVIDEIGVQTGSDFERNLLYSVLNHRYENGRSTIIISNLGREEVTAYLGERAIDRLREDGCDLIVMKWESRRGRG